jgi:hypothetical protein
MHWRSLLIHVVADFFPTVVLFTAAGIAARFSSPWPSSPGYGVSLSPPSGCVTATGGEWWLAVFYVLAALGQLGKAV